MIRFPVRATDSCPLRRVHTSSGAHQASRSEGAGVLSAVLTISAEFTNAWIYTSTPSLCRYGTDRDSLTFALEASSYVGIICEN